MKKFNYQEIDQINQRSSQDQYKDLPQQHKEKIINSYNFDSDQEVSDIQLHKNLRSHTDSDHDLHQQRLQILKKFENNHKNHHKNSRGYDYSYDKYHNSKTNSKTDHSSTRINQFYFSKNDNKAQQSQRVNISSYIDSFLNKPQRRSSKKQETNPYQISIHSFDLNLDKSNSKKKINPQYNFGQLQKADKINKLIDQINIYPGNKAQYVQHLRSINQNVKQPIRTNFNQTKLKYLDTFLPQNNKILSSAYQLMKYRHNKRYNKINIY